jgi:hypothetical protein
LYANFFVVQAIKMIDRFAKAHRMLPLRVRELRILPAVAVALLAVEASAQTADPKTFKGAPVEPLSGTFMATQDVIVRAAPRAKADRAASLKRGERVTVVGRTPATKAEGAWLAVEREGKALGFVFGQMMMPLVDGTLEKELSGRVEVGRGIACAYTIRFEGKTKVEEEEVETSDYDVTSRCETKGRKFAFSAPMFMTETPNQPGIKGAFQINIDLLEITDDPDQALSTVLFYQRDDSQVVLDAVAPPEFRGEPTVTKKPAKDVPTALKGAVEIAFPAWGGKVWDLLAKREP